MQTNQRKSYIYAISAILLWSTVATAFKMSLQSMDFMQLLFVASSVSMLVLFLIILQQKKLNLLFATTRRELLFSGFIGFLNPFVYYLTLLKAYSILPAQIAQPLNYTWPIVLVLLSVPLLKQKLHIKSLISLLISFVGVFVISLQGDFTNFKIDQPFGVLLASSSSIIWSLFWIFNMKDKRDEVIKLFLNFFFGAGYSLLVVLLFSDFFFWDLISLSSSIYVGFFEMGITFVFWLKALQYTVSNQKISNLVYLSPFLSLIFIHFILGEEIYFTTIIGLILIILGIFVQQIKKNISLRKKIIQKNKCYE